MSISNRAQLYNNVLHTGSETHETVPCRFPVLWNACARFPPFALERLIPESICIDGTILSLPMGAGAVFAGSVRPLLIASACVAVAILLYAITLSLIVAAALSRLSVVHNSAAEYSEQVYFALPFVFSRRRGAVPGAAVPRRQAEFHSAFPQMCHSPTAPNAQCAICMDIVRSGHLKRRLACNHEYHKVRYLPLEVQRLIA